MALFDDLKNIQSKRETDYWEKLSDKDKKAFNTYMLNRFFSMHPDFVEIINYLQRFNLSLDREISYKLFMGIIPKNNLFFRYMKSQKEKEYNETLLNCICNCFEVKEDEGKEYIDILSKTENGKIELNEILVMYATDEKEIKKIMREFKNGKN